MIDRHVLGHGKAIVGLDAAEGLLEIARTRVPAGDFQLGDLEEPPFADGLFDLVTGFNSFQFATDPVRALAEARRMAKPTGRIVVMTWGTPEGMPAAALVAALKPLLPPPPPGAPGPFALSEAQALRALAQRAGLRPLEVADVDGGLENREVLGTRLESDQQIGALFGDGDAQSAAIFKGDAGA